MDRSSSGILERIVHAGVGYLEEALRLVVDTPSSVPPSWRWSWQEGAVGRY
jgi:hypothetical protein